MTLDNEQQRVTLLEIISKTQFPGAAVPMINGLIQSIQHAPVQAPVVPSTRQSFGVPTGLPPGAVAA